CANLHATDAPKGVVVHPPIRRRALIGAWTARAVTILTRILDVPARGKVIEGGTAHVKDHRIFMPPFGGVPGPIPSGGSVTAIGPNNLRASSVVTMRVGTRRCGGR